VKEREPVRKKMSRLVTEREPVSEREFVMERESELVSERESELVSERQNYPFREKEKG